MRKQSLSMSAGAHHQAAIAAVNVLQCSPRTHHIIKWLKGKSMRILVQRVSAAQSPGVRRLVDRHKVDTAEIGTYDGFRIFGDLAVLCVLPKDL